METWKDIIGHEGSYQVSSIGRVRRMAGSPRCLKNRVLVNKVKKSGYRFVALSKGNEITYHHIHRLVANEFIPNPKEKPHVNHIDCNKSNNAIENLEWVTPSENMAHAIKNVVYNRSGVLRGAKNKSSIQIAQVVNQSILMVWGSCSEAAKHYGVCPAAIHKAVRCGGKSIGFHWRMIDKSEYTRLSKTPLSPPKLTVDIHSRDTSAAHLARKRNIERMTNEVLIGHGILCFKANGNLFRKSWDAYAKSTGMLTYIPVSNRFGGFKQFQKEVALHAFK